MWILLKNNLLDKTQDLQKHIKEKISNFEYLKKTEITKSGFINLFFNSAVLMLYVLGSISTKSIFAFANNAQLAEATKLIGEVQTKSFFFNPSDRQDMCNAEVALLTATENFDEVNLQISFSNFWLSFPWVIKSDFKEPGDEDVFRKIQSDFKKASINIADSEIRNQMSLLLERAKKNFL